MDKRLFLFLGLFFVAFFAYQKFILDPITRKPAPPPSGQSTPAPAPATSAPPVTASPQATPPEAATTPVPPPSQAAPESQITKTVVETSLYRAEFSNRGAVLSSFRLKNYTDDFNQPLEMVPQDTDGKNLPLSLEFDDKTVGEAAQNAIFSIAGDSISLRDNENGEIRFEYSDGNYSFAKTFVFKGGSYLLEYTASASAAGKALPVRVTWAPGVESLKNYKNAANLQPSRVIVNAGDKIKHYNSKDAEEFKKIGTTVKWAGVEDNYFLSILIPVNQTADAYMIQIPNSPRKDIHDVELVVAGQKAEPFRLSLFIGPKDYTILEKLGSDLESAVDFGFFGPVAKALFVVLHYFYRYTGNYGWAIVLLTILVKILFTPLMQKSFASAAKMQQMQPEMKKIQESYGKLKNDDPRKQNMNQEIMQLHKRYGVNPLGGCLPMLIQMPVLIAFYSLLSSAIELRKAPFIWWIQDLSRPDPYYVTPLLMGGTMFLQQRLTPVSDPIQKNMMYIMPIMFTYISFKLQSGLVLYWLLSNVLSIAHQYYFLRMQKKMVTVQVKNA